MASATQNRIARAFARDHGFVYGQTYSAFDLVEQGLGASFGCHRGHGEVTYLDPNNGCLEFRCGCTETIFVGPR